MRNIRKKFTVSVLTVLSLIPAMLALNSCGMFATNKNSENAFSIIGGIENGTGKAGEAGTLSRWFTLSETKEKPIDPFWWIKPISETASLYFQADDGLVSWNTEIKVGVYEFQVAVSIGNRVEPIISDTIVTVTIT